VKITFPVGVPEELVTTAVKVTGLWTRAGLGNAVSVTVGAEAVGCEVLTEIERGAEALELRRKNVLFTASNPPLKVAVRLLCRPAPEKVVLSAATP
jgi:hypothetical protein